MLALARAQHSEMAFLAVDGPLKLPFRCVSEVFPYSHWRISGADATDGVAQPRLLTRKPFRLALFYQLKMLQGVAAFVTLKIPTPSGTCRKPNTA
jgi:hypothetical protein